MFSFKSIEYSSPFSPRGRVTQVTKVGRGQKLGDNAEAVPFSDMTVEDLLRIVRSLPPEESAVAAVSRGLYYLDSRALAALLKELHKVGLSNRHASPHRHPSRVH